MEQTPYTIQRQCSLTMGVVAAFEEERLNRLKHTDKFPVSAIRSCLNTYNISMQDIDEIGFYFTEQTWKVILGNI